MNEVSSRPLRGLLWSARKFGLDVSTLLAGMPFDERSLEANVRIDWEVFVEFVERLTASVGGLPQLRALGEAQHEAFPELKKLLGQFVSPMRFFRFFWGATSRSAFPHVVVDYEEMPPDKAVVTVSLPQKYRDSPGFFVLTEGATCTSTLHIGLPPTQVEMELRARSATYRVTLPPPRRLAAPIDDVAEAAIVGIEAVHTRFINLFRLREETTLATDRERLQRAASAWKLTRREGEVLDLLVRGRRNKEISSALGCAEATVEIHVTHILRKTSAASRTDLASQFWR
jgi:DNA-binding NarL/FixJ family response regulator